jgi:hypothetical protein
MQVGKKLWHSFTSNVLKTDGQWWSGPDPQVQGLKRGNSIQARYVATKGKMPAAT